MNYYDQQAFRAIRAGERIGRLRAPEPGQDGVDVHGHALLAKQPKSLAVRIDGSIQVQSGVLTATCDGLLDFSTTSLRIVRDLEVKGYVDFSTGNIDFPGDVVVQQGVRDCFEVRVGGNLSVRDLVEAATLVVGKNATLDRGMAGHEKGSLTVGRDLSATYVTNTRIDVGRDATIANELTNCHATVGRRFVSPSGVVAGGTLRVAAACEVLQLGSEGAPATELWLGTMPDLESLLTQCAETLAKVEERCVTAKARLGELKRAATRLTASQAEELTELEFSDASWRSRRTALLAAARAAHQTLRDNTCVDLTVRGHLYTGVQIRLGRYTAEPRADLRGPVRIWLDERGEPQITDLSTKSTTPLSQAARVIRNPESKEIPGLGVSAAPAAKAA